MVYTVTFNPAIDYIVTLDSLCQGGINRCRTEDMTFGGKGINVSAVLHELGTPTKALGFCAGFTGRAIRDGLEASGVAADFVELAQGNSRINVKIKADSETEINGSGPSISADELRQFFDKLTQLQSGDYIVLAGSVPPSVPQDIYRQILERLSGRGVQSAVDAQGRLLTDTLAFEPFVIKPNKQELEQIFNCSLDSREQIADCARELQKLGARNVLVSMAGDGSLLLDESGRVHTMGVCRGTIISSVGAGDSMLAGFISGYISSGDHAYAHKLATACGGAAAFSCGTPKRELISTLLTQL